MTTVASAPVTFRTFVFPAIAMAAIVLLSNFLVQFPINNWLTWGAFTYPIVFFVTDVCNRWAGPALARRVAVIGVTVGVVSTLFLVSQWRIALASGTAFLVAQLLDISVFNTLRRQSWWRAPFIGSTVASAIDTVIFFSIAFAGTELNWMLLGLGDFSVKFAMAALLLVPYRYVYIHLRTLIN